MEAPCSSDQEKRPGPEASPTAGFDFTPGGVILAAGYPMEKWKFETS
jgi:hypothetical protein